MAEQSKGHLWLNSLIAAFALITSIASAIFSWLTYAQKSETLGFTLTPTYDCPLQYKKIPEIGKETGVLGFCTRLFLTNQNDYRISVLSYSVIVYNEFVGIGEDFMTLLSDEDGRKALLPLSLDGGEAKQLLVRVPLYVPDSVASIADAFIARPNASQLTLRQLREEVATSGSIDLLGNRIEVDIHRQVWHRGPSPLREPFRAVLKMTTGRGNDFSAELSFPRLFLIEKL